MRPVIGITGRRKQGRDIVGMLDSMADYDMAMFVEAYWRAVIAAGGLPVGLSLDLPGAESAPALDGILLTGGGDVDPALYGAEAHPETQTPDPVRDEHEFELLAAAKELDIPVLCICRGVQVANVFFGGTLHQDVPPHAGFDQPDAHVHEVEFDKASVLGGLYGATTKVNSLHHQAIDAVGDGIKVVGTAEDGTIEAIESDAMNLVGVQWHPEMLPSAPTDPSFKWLIDEAAAKQS